MASVASSNRQLVGSTRERVASLKLNPAAWNMDVNVAHAAANFTDLQCVGNGAFGFVYKAWDKHNQRHVAIKMFDLDHDGCTEADVKDLFNEVEVMNVMDHPNLVKYYMSFMNGSHLWIVMELACGGSANDLLQAYKRPPLFKIGCLPEKYVRAIVRGTLEALAYMHDAGMIHRDIKAANVLITEMGEIKLADFGVSVILKSRDDVRHTLVGTPAFIAPEVFKSRIKPRDDSEDESTYKERVQKIKGYDERADIWSLGCMIYELLYGECPWYDLDPISQMTAGAYSKPPLLEGPGKLFSPECKDFQNKCCQKRVENRPTARELLNHPWITGGETGPHVLQMALQDAKFRKDANAHLRTAPAPGVPRNGGVHLLAAQGLIPHLQEPKRVVSDGIPAFDLDDTIKPGSTVIRKGPAYDQENRKAVEAGIQEWNSIVHGKGTVTLVLDTIDFRQLRSGSDTIRPAQRGGPSMNDYFYGAGPGPRSRRKGSVEKPEDPVFFSTDDEAPPPTLIRPKKRNSSPMKAGAKQRPATNPEAGAGAGFGRPLGAAEANSRTAGYRAAQPQPVEVDFKNPNLFQRLPESERFMNNQKQTSKPTASALALQRVFSSDDSLPEMALLASPSITSAATKPSLPTPPCTVKTFKQEWGAIAERTVLHAAIEEVFLPLDEETEKHKRGLITDVYNSVLALNQAYPDVTFDLLTSIHKHMAGHQSFSDILSGNNKELAMPDQPMEKRKIFNSMSGVRRNARAERLRRKWVHGGMDKDEAEARSKAKAYLEFPPHETARDHDLEAYYLRTMDTDWPFPAYEPPKKKEEQQEEVKEESSYHEEPTEVDTDFLSEEEEEESQMPLGMSTPSIMTTMIRRPKTPPRRRNTPPSPVKIISPRTRLQQALMSDDEREELIRTSPRKSLFLAEVSPVKKASGPSPKKASATRAAPVKIYTDTTDEEEQMVTIRRKSSSPRKQSSLTKSKSRSRSPQKRQSMGPSSADPKTEDAARRLSLFLESDTEPVITDSETTDCDADFGNTTVIRSHPAINNVAASFPQFHVQSRPQQQQRPSTARTTTNPAATPLERPTTSPTKVSKYTALTTATPPSPTKRAYPLKTKEVSAETAAALIDNIIRPSTSHLPNTGSSSFGMLSDLRSVRPNTGVTPSAGGPTAPTGGKYKLHRRSRTSVTASDVVASNAIPRPPQPALTQHRRGRELEEGGMTEFTNAGAARSRGAGPAPKIMRTPPSGEYEYDSRRVGLAGREGREGNGSGNVYGMERVDERAEERGRLSPRRAEMMDPPRLVRKEKPAAERKGLGR